MTKHNVLLAVFISSILVGSGQYYNGQITKGNVLALFFWFSVLMPLPSLNIIIAPIIYVLALIDSYRVGKHICNRSIKLTNKNTISLRLDKA